MQNNFLRPLCWAGNLVRTGFLVTFPTLLLPVMAVKTAVLMVFQQFFFQMETRSGGGLEIYETSPNFGNILLRFHSRKI